jgi:hypothetical protein
MLNGIMVNVVMLNVVMLDVNMLNVVMLSALTLKSMHTMYNYLRPFNTLFRNKLARLSLGKITTLVGHLRVQHLTLGAPLSHVAFKTMPENFRLGWRGLPEANRH